MAFRIEILAQNDEINVKDGRAVQIESFFEENGKKTNVRVVDVYTSENETAQKENFTSSLANPVTQKINAALNNFDWALEIGYLPGVTDNVGNSVSELLELLALRPVYMADFWPICRLTLWLPTTPDSNPTPVTTLWGLS